jgi:hypothetical protein
MIFGFQNFLVFLSLFAIFQICFFGLTGLLLGVSSLFFRFSILNEARTGKKQFLCGRKHGLRFMQRLKVCCFH